MKAIERIFQYFEYKNIRQTNFEKEIGASSGYFSVMARRNADMGESMLLKIADYCQDLSLLWLLTGTGSMLKDGNQPISLVEKQQLKKKEVSPQIQGNDQLISVIMKQAEEIVRLKQELEAVKRGDQ